MTHIHPTALIDSHAKIGKGSKVGPYSVIGPEVVIGENCDIQEHVVIRGRTTLKDDVKVFPFCVLGGEPQHLGYKGEPTTVEIGNRVILRESCTVHRGTTFGTGKTVIDDDVYLMAYTHVAHDCEIGRKVIICNSVQLAGHVVIGNNVVIGGASEVAQFCRVGQYCYVGGGSTLRKDLPPFLLGKGNDFQVQGINVVGLEKNGFSSEAISKLKKIYKIFYIQKNTVSQAIERATVELENSNEAAVFLNFIQTSTAGFIR